jgi:3-deoxy-D-manno-octulosonic-acid transferase
MAVIPRLYALAARAAASVLPIATPFSTKLARGVAARRGAVARLDAWARTGRDHDRPLVWLHAPSVGEALMAQAIAEALRSQRPDVQLALTIFSPSAERLLDRMPVDVAGYLPWDTPADAAATVGALRPAVVGFVRTEVWPLMLAAAQHAGARAALVNAVLAPSSSRLRWPARALLSGVYGGLDAVGAVSEAHAERIRSLGVATNRVQVTGDARFDQVLQRIDGIDRTDPLLQRIRATAAPLLVAGSTWPADEHVLLDALGGLLRDGRLRLAVAPHEPEPAHLEDLDARLDAAKVAHARLAELEAGRAPADVSVVVVDRVGVLADLYAAADAAYVGGGFGNAGLHSIIEPAALGVPVLFGPRHGNAIEADELERAGGGAVVDGADGMLRRVQDWLDDDDVRIAAGAAARAFTRERAGGAAANARLLEDLVDATRRRG